MRHDYLKAWSQSDAFRRVFGAIISQLIEEGRVNFSGAHDVRAVFPYGPMEARRFNV